MYGHIRRLSSCRNPSACPAGHTFVPRPTHHLGLGRQDNPAPATVLNPELMCAFLFHCATVLNTIAKVILIVLGAFELGSFTFW